MTDAVPPVLPDQIGRTAQIIVAALMMGQLAFAAVCLTVTQNGGQPARKQQFPVPIEIVGVVIGMIQIGLRFIVPTSISAVAVKRLRNQPPVDWRSALAPIYMTTTIVTHALLEGAGLFNGVAYMIGQHWMSLGMMGIMIALMAISFPTQMQFESWAEQVQRDNS